MNVHSDSIGITVKNDWLHSNVYSVWFWWVLVLHVAYMDAPWASGEITHDVLRGWMGAPARSS